MACGLPVIATRHSGLPEQVVNGRSGIVVPEGDWRALADAIVELVEHPERWAALGRFGHAHVTEQYNAKILMDRQVVLYESLLWK